LSTINCIPSFKEVNNGRAEFDAVLARAAIMARLRLPYLASGPVVWLATIASYSGGGWAGDRFSKRAIVVGCMVAHAAGLLLLASAAAFSAVAAFAVLHGLAWGVRGPLMSAIRADYFGSTSFGTISGISSMVVMFGMIGGPLIAGIIADRTGSYEVAFRILAGFAALGSIFFVLARRPSPPRRRH